MTQDLYETCTGGVCVCIQGDAVENDFLGLYRGGALSTPPTLLSNLELEKVIYRGTVIL